MTTCQAGGKPSTWFPPEGLVEQDSATLFSLFYTSFMLLIVSEHLHKLTGSLSEQFENIQNFDPKMVMF